MINLTVLCENSVSHAEGLLGEHGFAAMIESDDRRYLFDTGQGHTILNNATRLGVALTGLDGIILSHGHWDHAGGLHDILMLNAGGVHVYAHPGVFTERYYTEHHASKKPLLRFAGIRFPRQELESFGADFDMNSSAKALTDNMILTGEVPRRTSFEKPAAQLRAKFGTDLVMDEVVDEQSLIIVSEEGLVIVVGCSHPGIINIIQHSIDITGVDKIRAIIGGTHLMFHDDTQLISTIDALSKFAPRMIATTHCTGSKANALIRQRFPGEFVACAVGTALCL